MDKEYGRKLNNVRQRLRKESRYQEADTIREVLENDGFTVQDREQSSDVYKKRDKAVELYKQQRDEAIQDGAQYSFRYNMLKKYMRGSLLSVEEKKRVEKLLNI